MPTESGNDSPQAPPPEAASRVTELLVDASGGNRAALDALLPLVYDDLRRLARRRLRLERTGHTLSTTALVHEAYLRLVDQSRVQWRDRAHFFGVASEAMRRILINYAEAARAAKRGGGAPHVPLDDLEVGFTDTQIEELLSLDQALARLEVFNPRGARVVTCRYFGGLSHDEIAEVLETSTATVRRSWSAARAWLRQELGDSVTTLGGTAAPPPTRS